MRLFHLLWRFLVLKQKIQISKKEDLDVLYIVMYHLGPLQRSICYSSQPFQRANLPQAILFLVHVTCEDRTKQSIRNGTFLSDTVPIGSGALCQTYQSLRLSPIPNPAFCFPFTGTDPLQMLAISSIPISAFEEIELWQLVLEMA